jgi:hypothetical protein
MTVNNILFRYTEACNVAEVYRNFEKKMLPYFSVMKMQVLAPLGFQFILLDYTGVTYWMTVMFIVQL